MLRNSQKITTSISPGTSTNQWPQNLQILDDHRPLMASSSSVNNKAAMEKTNQDHQPHRCPRCDSSNTKFCYYNNYSLSQPRHFCKACKRYWTRGGTLRNVPVGGGCRKNKRVKRQVAANGGGDGISTSAAAGVNPSVQSLTDLSSPASSHINNPLFYGLSTNPLDLSFPFSSLGSTRVSATGFDLQHQMDGLGLGFSSGVVTAADVPTNGDYKNGFKQIQDVIAPSNSPFYSSTGNNSIFFGSSSNFAASTSTMASLLASGLQQQKYSTGLKDIQTGNNDHLMPYGDTHMNGQIRKDLKAEGENRLPLMSPNPTAQINSIDSSSLVWNTAWFDPSNVGSSSSVPSLI